MTVEQAARAVLTYLHLHLPMGFWSVTRVKNGRQSYLYLDENDYGLAAGGSHPWGSSFCIHMASGAGPDVAPDHRVGDLRPPLRVPTPGYDEGPDREVRAFDTSSCVAGAGFEPATSGL